MIFQPKNAIDTHGYYRPMQGAPGQQKLAVQAAVVSPTIPPGARLAKAFYRAGSVRATFNGVDPVASTTGVLLHDGYEEYYSQAELSVLKLTRETENGEVEFIYYS